jgi:hypothetical protein
MAKIDNHGDVTNQKVINIQNMLGNVGVSYLFMSSQFTTAGGMINTGVSLNTNYYNLFVIGEETYSDGHFIVPKDRALTESMAPETKTLFSSLSDDEIAQIKTFPSLFASENRGYGKTDEDHQACYGLVTDIRVQDNGIKIHFQPLSPISQQRLNEIIYKLGIQGTPSFNELNRTHWAIKRVNLIEELKAAGISVLAPT